MMMRYRGGGVGHKSTRDATNKFLTDRDKLDIPTTADKDTDSDENITSGEEGEEVEIMDGPGESGENVCAGDEEREPNLNEDNDKSDSDDEDGDEEEFEEEFDYGLPLAGGDRSDNEDNEDSEADEADDWARGW
jgi:hypothetical protein